MSRGRPSTTGTAFAAHWDEAWGLAVAFGIASVPWTYAFVAGIDLPLWPSFLASASFFAAGGGRAGLLRSYLGNAAGIGYAAVTLVVVGAAGGGVLTLSLVVGGAMLLASLHAFLPRLDFTPAVFIGYATLFGVHASGAGVAGIEGLAGETAVVLLAMFLGAVIALVVERASRVLGRAKIESTGPSESGKR